MKYQTQRKLLETMRESDKPVYLGFEQAFVQFYGGYAWISYDRDRIGIFTDLNPDGSVPADPTASGVQNADYNANRYSAGVLVGYDYPISNVTIAPRG